MSHSAIARDTRLSLAARAVAFWILDNPSEVINPDAIAQANAINIRQVKVLLGELARHGYLNSPQRIKGKHGHFAYTPYTLKAAAAQSTVNNSTVDGQDVYGPHTLSPHTVETSTDRDEIPPEITAESAPVTVKIAAEMVIGDAHVRVYTPTRDAAGEKDMSLKAKDKDKSKRKKQKKKYISPAGESVSSEISDSPLPDASWQSVMTAVGDVFKVKPGGFAGILANQLIGKSKSGQRREFQIDPAMTAVEIVAFGQWYREVYPGKNGEPARIPTTAETLRDRVYQFRDDTTRYTKKMALAQTRLDRLLKPAPAPEAAAVQREKPLPASDMLPVQEHEVDGFVKMGVMTADEMPRPTMKMIYDRITARMRTN